MSSQQRLEKFYDYLMTRAPNLKKEFINMEIERKFVEIFPEVLRNRMGPGERLLPLDDKDIPIIAPSNADETTKQEKK